MDFMKQFSQRQFFILRIETLKQNTSDTLKRLQSFLNLSIAFEATDIRPLFHRKLKSKPLDCDTRDSYANFLYEDYVDLPALVNGPRRNSHQPYFYPQGSITLDFNAS
jgi:hypothetical protein